MYFRLTIKRHRAGFIGPGAQRWLCHSAGQRGKGAILNCEYAAKYYGVPACIGRRVIAYGKPGIIAEDRGNYIGILLDSDKPGNVNNYHPCDGIEYLGMGRVRPMTRSQRKYKEYIDADWFGGSFAEWIGIRA